MTKIVIRSGKVSSFLAAALVVCVVSAARGAEDENPFKTTKVGDWVEYRMTGPNMEGKTKMTVVTKDAKELTYTVAGSFTALGRQMVAPLSTQKIDLTKSYDPIVAANVQRNGVTVEKKGEGKEKVKLGNKVFDTTWVKSQSRATASGVTVITDTKMWFSKNVPLSGMVRMETTTTAAGSTTTTKLDLIGSGSK